MRAERKVQAVMKENAELKKELEQLKSKCAQLEVLIEEVLKEMENKLSEWYHSIFFHLKWTLKI